MQEQIWIKNISSERQAVVWIPAFAPGEERLVSREDADHLLMNSSFAECEIKFKWIEEDSQKAKK